ncbi:MAG: hypothetical protein ACR2OD_05825 [Gaiellaceae bacterium]
MVVYRLDQDNRLASVGQGWSGVAQATEASELTPDAVTGKSVFSFIADAATQELYSLIFERVRQTEETVVLPFRCDSPKARRFMELKIAPTGNAQLDIEARTLRLESRPNVALLDAACERSDDLLSVCGWCKRVNVADDWVEVELAVARLELFEEPTLPQLSHGVCPHCASELERQIESQTSRSSG